MFANVEEARIRGRLAFLTQAKTSFIERGALFRAGKADITDAELQRIQGEIDRTKAASDALGSTQAVKKRRAFRCPQWRDALSKAESRRRQIHETAKQNRRY